LLIRILTVGGFFDTLNTAIGEIVANCGVL